MNKTALAAVVFVVLFIALLAYLTTGLSRHRVEVCIEFHGRTECRTASASTREAARRAATDNACAMLASGMADSMACSNTPPASLKWLD